MPGQIPKPSLTVGALPSVGALAGTPTTTLTTALSDQLKLAEICGLDAIYAPSLKRPLTLLKSEMEEEHDRRKRRREKNKVAAARCRYKKKERTDLLQKEAERLEVVNAELKGQVEGLRSERQQLIHLLNLHRPTCIVRADSTRSSVSDEHGPVSPPGTP